MGEVVSFVNYRPPQRFDLIPWTEVRIEESATETGTYYLLETIPLSPVDTDPADPAFRSFTTELGTAIDYWYRVIFADATADVSQPTTPIQNTALAAPFPTSYATVDELQQLLRLNAPTSIQQEAMQRALDAAAAEIDWDLGLTATAPAASPPHPLIVEVNLERAVEHWRQAQSPFGVIGLGSETEPIVTARNSWYRHHLKLSPLRMHQGVA